MRLDQIERRRDAAREDDGVQIEQVLRDGQTATDGLAHLLEDLEPGGLAAPRADGDWQHFVGLSAELAEATQDADRAGVGFDAAALAARAGRRIGVRDTLM